MNHFFLCFYILIALERRTTNKLFPFFTTLKNTCNFHFLICIKMTSLTLNIKTSDVICKFPRHVKRENLIKKI